MQLNYSKLNGVIDAGIGFAPNDKMGMGGLDGNEDFLSWEPIDGVIEFYGIPKFYKNEARFFNMMLDVDNIKDEHMDTIENYLLGLGHISNFGEFRENYERTSDRRQKNKDKRDEMDAKNRIIVSAEEQRMKQAYIEHDLKNKGVDKDEINSVVATAVSEAFAQILLQLQSTNANKNNADTNNPAKNRGTGKKDGVSPKRTRSRRKAEVSVKEPGSAD